MIRKDVLPEVTVKTIQSILKENGIDALISNNKSYKEGWYSCSLEITGLKDISTNGKGVELNHAYASAYAEMLERIQSGLLLDGLFPEKVNTSKSEDISDELMDIYESYFNHIIQDYNKDKAEKLLQYNKKFCVLSSYFDVIRKNVVELPDKFISALCGSNGVSSGNSKEEAFVQGTCEVFERYINYIIHHEEYNADKFPIIDEKYFSNTYAYTLIKKIEKKGLKVIVKDCTLNGLFPVIGVLVMNMSRTKYYFAIGSDINLDICIQRCITEMFQGKDINIDFRYHMHSIVEQYDNFWYLKNKRNEYAKSVRDGRGKLPRRFFLGESKDYYNGIIEPFEYNNISNKDAAVRINQILAKLKVNVYIKDYSYLEFDTLRIYIPGMSEMPVWKDDNVLDLYIDYYEFLDSYKCRNYKQMSRTLSSLLKNPLFSNEYKLSKLLNINKETNGGNKSLLDMDVHYFLVAISLFQKNYDDVIKNIIEYQKICSIQPRKAYLQLLSLEAVINNVNKTEYEQFIHNTVVANEVDECITLYDMFYAFKNNGVDIVCCAICENCSVKDLCNYNKWKEIIICLSKKKEYFEKTYKYMDSIYQDISLD